jgi:energy-coupling factor transporter ATP-binding protein EcfA2
MPEELPLLPAVELLRPLVEGASSLPGLASEQGRLSRLVEDYGRGVLHSERAIVVAFVGATGAGKSTLLNALAGDALAVEGTTRPTSTQPVVYAPEDAVVGSLIGPGVKSVRYRVHPAAPWSGQVFVDTPDLNSIAAEHRERAAAVLEQADVALVVMHKGAVVEATQAEFLAGFARRRRLLFVLNFADQLTVASREALKSQAARVAASVLKLSADEVQVFAISASEAKTGRDPSGEWPRLISTLQALGQEAGREKVRRSNAVGILRELSDRLVPALEEVDRVQRAVEASLERGIENTRGAFLEDYTQRLDSARAHLSNEVRRRASAHWWGPAAAWMRLSLLGASGLGTAALVGRRNLPLGLAVAAVSAAVDRVKEHTLSAAADRRVVTAEDPALVQSVRTAVTAARSAAHQAGVEASRLALPTTEELLEALQTVRESAWGYTEGAAVEQAVSRWWRWARWLLLPLVNLPLGVLLGHVAYNVIRAYVREQYLGIDYFLNAGAFAAVLSLAGALLASLSLSRTARQVRLLGSQRFSAGLAAWAEQAKSGVTQAFAQWREPAERLVKAVEPFR